MPFDCTPVEQETEASRIIRRGLAWLEQGPAFWCQRAFENGAARCAVGSIGVSFDADVLEAANNAVGIMNAVAQRRNFPSIVGFNDAPSTTYADVLNLMREAAAEAAKARN